MTTPPIAARTLLICLLIIAFVSACGGGGGGDDSESFGNTTNNNIPIICQTSELLIDGRCVRFDEDPTPPQNTTSLRPQLSAGEPVQETVTLDWVPPSESWEGLSPPFVSAYVIYISQPMGGFYQVIEQIRIDNAGLLTYVLDLPGSGRWGISMTAISTTGSESSHSNLVEIVIS